MTPEQVLDHPALVLDQRARKRYFDDGFLTVPGYVAPAWLDRLRAVVAAKIEASRALTASDDQFDLAPDHSAEKPNIRRLRKAVDQHPELWAFAQDPAVVDLVADLLGPDVRFHSSKLNFKWSEGGDAVRWHQDIQAWPHTNFGVLTFCVYLDDTGPEQGPLTAVPGTHRGPLFEQFDDDGRWTGALADRDVATLPTATAVELGGPAGTVVLLHCRVVHGSAANYSSRMRPLLLNVYAAADALPMTPAPTPTSRTGLLVRGREPAHVHMEPYPARLPPRWDQVGYRSIFSAQAPRLAPCLGGPGASAPRAVSIASRLLRPAWLEIDLDAAGGEPALGAPAGRRRAQDLRRAQGRWLRVRRPRDGGGLRRARRRRAGLRRSHRRGLGAPAGRVAADPRLPEFAAGDRGARHRAPPHPHDHRPRRGPRLRRSRARADRGLREGGRGARAPGRARRAGGEGDHRHRRAAGSPARRRLHPPPPGGRRLRLCRLAVRPVHVRARRAGRGRGRGAGEARGEQPARDAASPHLSERGGSGQHAVRAAVELRHAAGGAAARPFSARSRLASST